MLTFVQAAAFAPFILAICVWVAWSDMAKMKIEFLHHYKARHGLTVKDRLIAYLPRYAPWAARLPWLAK